MSERICPECGYPITNESTCPECGYPIENDMPIGFDNNATIEPTTINNANNSQIEPTLTNDVLKTDWAQYFYECGVIGWNAFKKYFHFTGRASRREYWSFMLILAVTCIPSYTNSYGCELILAIFAFPLFGVSIRRLHDIGKCGWWCICPIVPFFLYLKLSDKGPNKYGVPYPAKEILKSK